MFHRSFPFLSCREHPNKAIASFSGSLEVSLKPGGGALGKGAQESDRPKTVKEPITSENLLLRGTVLRNTKVCVYCCCCCLLLCLLLSVVVVVETVPPTVTLLLLFVVVVVVIVFTM